MVKSNTQMLEQATNLSVINFQKNSEVSFSLSSEAKEVLLAEKNSERLNVNARFSRLRRRMRNRSSSIL